MEIPFRSSERAGLGAEWELQLVDRSTRELTAGAVEAEPADVERILSVGASLQRRRAVACGGGGEGGGCAG